VKADHYHLLWTLEQGLGTDWTPPLAGAWMEAYKTLADYMIADASAALSSEVIVDVRN
jgi:hemoglobin-like flavoprotein